MSNSIGCIGTLVQDPESLTIKDKPATKIRFAVKATSKKYTDRFVNMLCMGYDSDTAQRLRKGDQVFVTGPLECEEYVSKKTKERVKSDVMGFGSRIAKVVKSPSFFGGGDQAPADAAEPTGPATQGAGPLDDLDF
jgi:single-stranded DNA-binding protein